MRSKRNLINFPPAWGVKLEPIGPNRFGFGFVELTDRAMTPVGAATTEMIQERITYLRSWVNEMITSEGKDPSQYQDIIRQAKTAANATADRAYCAACVLERLDDVEREMADIKPGPIAALRRSALNAIYYALALATDVHALTVVDNESGIVGRETGRCRMARATAPFLDSLFRRLRIFGATSRPPPALAATTPRPLGARHERRLRRTRARRRPARRRQMALPLPAARGAKPCAERWRPRSPARNLLGRMRSSRRARRIATAWVARGAWPPLPPARDQGVQAHRCPARSRTDGPADAQMTDNG